MTAIPAYSVPFSTPLRPVFRYVPFPRAPFLFEFPLNRQRPRRRRWPPFLRFPLRFPLHSVLCSSTLRFPPTPSFYESLGVVGSPDGRQHPPFRRTPFRFPLPSIPLSTPLRPTSSDPAYILKDVGGGVFRGFLT